MAKWMWYPGDYECRTVRDITCQRYYRDTVNPPFWRIDDCYPIVTFMRRFTLQNDDKIRIASTGEMYVDLDGPGNILSGFTGELSLKKGEHYLEIRVFGRKYIPALCVEGRELCSDAAWSVSCHDHISHRVALGEKPVGMRFKTKTVVPQSVKSQTHLYDFGAETMGYISFETTGKAIVNIYYGESLEECLDVLHCEQTDCIKAGKAGKYRTKIAKAFRFVKLICEGATIENVKGISEYSPSVNKSVFLSSDKELNAIYEVSVKTFHLCMREFFIDGIKRDRWPWSGDAYQSYLMNYYSFDDSETVKRTMLALAGKEPVKTHVNNIMDYTFFWIIGFAEYYEHSKDTEFCLQFFEKAVAYMDFCIERTNSRGLMEGLLGDWVYVDWAENLDNGGELAYENILYYAALKKLAALSDALGKECGKRYETLASEVFEKLKKLFWSDSEKCFLYHSKDTKTPSVKRQPNIMAILFDVLPPSEQKLLAENILMSDKADKITTPYMRFFELAALSKTGYAKYVADEIKSYWGGMLKEGATSFWETYDPTEKGAARYAMYGRKYGKSLCHAWGAAPIYLIGRYLVGLEFDFQTEKFVLKPEYSLLGDFTFRAPALGGSVEISVKNGKVFVFSDTLSGTVRLPDGTYEKISRGKREVFA